MQQPVLQTLGSWLAVAYTTYVIVLLVGWLTALHTYVLVGTLYVTRQSRWAPGRFSAQELVVEFFYGFLNPLVYLIVLVHIPGAPWPQTAWLTAPAWALFVLFWGARVLGRHPAQDSAFWRRAIQLVLAASLLLVIVYLLHDCAGVVAKSWLEPPNDTRGPAAWRIPLLTFFALSWLSLYLIPAALLFAHLRSTATPAAWAAERRYLLGNGRGTRSAALVAAAVVGVNVITALWWTSEHSVRELVHRKRDRIIAAATAQGIDPRLLASVLYVVQRDTVSVLSMSLEQLVMGAWLSDPKNHVNLAGPLDLSIGLTQVKPSTALQAMDVYLSTATPAKGWGSEKELRPLPPLGPEWALPALPKDAASRLEAPFPRPPTKPEIVARLFTDEGSLSIAAFILALYEAQWRSADPAWDISSKPEITATLYQIGFARSHPHADPRANDFGDAVGNVYRTPWMQQHFGSTVGAQPSRQKD